MKLTHLISKTLWYKESKVTISKTPVRHMANLLFSSVYSSTIQHVMLYAHENFEI